MEGLKGGALRRRVDRYIRSRVAEAIAASPPPRPPHPDSTLHGTYVGDGRVLVAPVWGGRILAASDDLGLTPALVAHGVYDVPLTNFIQKQIKPGDTVFDVGANIGVFTILAGYQVWERGNVIAYEANPRVLPILRDNVAMNWFLDRVEIVPKAAAGELGNLPFLVPSHFDTWGSLMPVEDLVSTEGRSVEIEHVEVDAEPLDVHAGRFERIDLIKVDVQGAEERVFAGMEGLLGSGVVRRVSFAMARSQLGDDWEPFRRRLVALRDAGWAFSTIPESGEPEPAALEALFDRTPISQVLMTPNGG